MVDSARDPVASRRLDEFLRAARAGIEPVTAAQAEIARQAYRDFGKGSGHAAKLNFGDCFAYALARTRGEVLLFKGRDFRETDVQMALIPGWTYLVETREPGSSTPTGVIYLLPEHVPTFTDGAPQWRLR